MKPKREITLGEMKDECDLLYSNKTPCTECTYKDVCSFHQCGGMCHIDLTDPPRFTEAQMALLKALWAVGVLELDDDNEYDQVIMYTAHGRIGGFRNKGGIELSLKAGETLDLAELFGKDAT